MKHCHLKRKAGSHRSNAFDKTLCGLEDPGLYAYTTVEPGEPLPEESEAYPYCPACVGAHAAKELKTV